MDSQPPQKRVKFGIDSKAEESDKSDSGSSYVPSDSSSSSTTSTPRLPTIVLDSSGNDMCKVYWPTNNRWYTCHYSESIAVGRVEGQECLRNIDAVINGVAKVLFTCYVLQFSSPSL